MSDYPSVYRIKQKFARSQLGDLEAAVEQAVDRLFPPGQQSPAPGSTIGITVGSRGITNIVPILTSIVAQLKSRELQPFLFACMGSHGRGEPEGQKEILESLGITPESIGAPVSCSGEVRLLGHTTKGIQGLPVYCAEEALSSDGVIVVNRIKTHTSFSGTYESGMMKMMAVGMGRAKGASMVHSLGVGRIADAIPAIAGVILERVPVVGGIAIVENEYEETALIEGIPKAELWEREKELLILSKSYMPKLPVKHMDLCIVKEMGKNYSGTGMDTNIIGRLRIQGIPEPEEPFIQYLGVLDLSEPSHGNATGIGLADYTTKRLVSKIDRQATYLNCMTSGLVVRAAVPMTFETDEELMKNALSILRLAEPSSLKLAIIHNTLHLDEMWVSEALWREIQDDPKIELVEGPVRLQFGDEGQLQL
ncbi:lactate racemase domain-containing protein [Paenibacillus sp. YK5]